MTTGYFVAEGVFRRPFFDVDVSFPDVGNRSMRIAFEVDTGADRTLLSPLDARRLHSQLGIDIREMPRGSIIGGIGGYVETRIVRATLVIGSYRTTMRIPIVDLPPGPYDMPSLIGRDILYDFALFMEHSRDRLFLLRDSDEIFSLLDY
jgi:hypothetical protein